MKLVKTMSVSAAILCLFFVSTQSFASDKTQSISPVTVKYLGVSDYKPVVQIDIENTLNEELYFTLKDENGNALYSEKLTERKYSRKFQFNEVEGSTMNLTITLSSKNSRKTEVFNISNVTTVVEDIVVTRLR
ncbi:MAG: hypothetical protein JWQ96_885 [Segetibacter sp.]|nr:hypothetical protein [Segetibacter sp.]